MAPLLAPDVLMSMAKSDEFASEAAFLRGGGAAGALIAAYDWASTPLGPLAAWPQSLKVATAIVLHSPAPMALLWGEDGVTLYNDAYAALLGQGHPRTLGSKARETSAVADLSDRAIRAGLAGQSVTLHDLPVTLNRAGRPEQFWLNIDCSPVTDDAGVPVGVLTIVVETTSRVLAERKAALEIERLRSIFQQAPGFICLLSGPDHVFEFVNDAHKRLFGDRDAVGRPIREAFADIADQGFPEILDQVWATEQRYIARASRGMISTWTGGPRTERFLDLVLEPVTGPSGEIVGIFLEGFDVTENVRAQTAIAESNRRLTAAIAVARLGAFEMVQETGAATLDARAREIYGFEADEPLTIADLTQRIDSRDLARVAGEAAAADASRRKRNELEYRIRRPDGAVRNVVSVSDRMLGPDGRIQRVVGVFDDVTERRRAEQRQRMLINELNHRVKNTLATVQSIAAQTLRAAPDLPSARASFEARLLALAAAHDLLNAESWHGALLPDVVASAMAPFESRQRPQISRSGPPVWLTPQQALGFSMALHELATNAVKYGALSGPDGRVTIHWSRQEDDELVLSWAEQGGPPVVPPDRPGFGSRLLQRSLARELAGEAALTFAPEGVRWQIRFKMETAAPAPEFVVPGP
ncbi:PAS domain-containing protein [Phenylobacterium sp. LjRoot219]|uniref:sensor histidine kinase n=1 Tax=Phenylobacterium sp. LjRoot219 TaxID=3342283 RepID=UPI003ECD5C0D